MVAHASAPLNTRTYLTCCWVVQSSLAGRGLNKKTSITARTAQAGQVWFPDSALKTANAMEEFALERLPLFILANWRGFSGGQRDLFEGVLQAGSLIVEQLRRYSEPVFVYMLPGAELRGGAWVVVDSQVCEAYLYSVCVDALSCFIPVPMVVAECTS